jgi:hypothetical protein
MTPFDIGKIRRRLDFIPGVAIEEGLARVVAAMPAQPDGRA